MIFGAVGALFAVPTLAVVNAVVRYLANRDWEKEAPREEEFLFPHEVARREQAEEKAQERQESVKNLASRVPSVRRLRSLRTRLPRLRTPPKTRGLHRAGGFGVGHPATLDNAPLTRPGDTAGRDAVYGGVSPGATCDRVAPFAVPIL